MLGYTGKTGFSLCSLGRSCIYTKCCPGDICLSLRLCDEEGGYSISVPMCTVQLLCPDLSFSFFHFVPSVDLCLLSCSYLFMGGGDFRAGEAERESLVASSVSPTCFLVKNNSK